jgi:hypothetical protein
MFLWPIVAFTIAGTLDCHSIGGAGLWPAIDGGRDAHPTNEERDSSRGRHARE